MIKKHKLLVYSLAAIVCGLHLKDNFIDHLTAISILYFHDKEL